MRFYLMAYSKNDSYWGDKIPRVVNFGKHGRLNLRGIKLFSDGMHVLSV